MRPSTGVVCNISRETFSGRSSVSTTPCTKRSQLGSSLLSALMNMRFTCRRTWLSRSFSVTSNGFMPGMNSMAKNSSVPSAFHCRVAQGLSKKLPRWR